MRPRDVPAETGQRCRFRLASRLPDSWFRLKARWRARAMYRSPVYMDTPRYALESAFSAMGARLTLDGGETWMDADGVFEIDVGNGRSLIAPQARTLQ